MKASGTTSPTAEQCVWNVKLIIRCLRLLVLSSSKTRNTALSWSAEFVSCCCSYYGYDLFTQGTLKMTVWGLCFIQVVQQAVLTHIHALRVMCVRVDFIYFWIIFSVKAGRIRPELEHNFKIFVWFDLVPVGTAAHGNKIVLINFW